MIYKLSKRSIAAALAAIFVLAGHGFAELAPQEITELKSAYQTILKKEKGPYGLNTCTCSNGERANVADKKGKVRWDPCGIEYKARAEFCSAYRNDPAEKLAGHGMYLGNIFTNAVHLWDETKDHDRVTKGFILEKYYMDNHPSSKLAATRSLRGISGAEYEVVSAPTYFEKYYGLAQWNDFQDYLVQYDLQRRYFLRGKSSLINEIRSLSISMERAYPPFKPVKDMVHNQLSAGLIPLIENFQKSHPQDKKHATDYKRLADLIRQLTNVNQSDLAEYLPMVADPAIKNQVEKILKFSRKQPLALLHALAELEVSVRNKVAQKEIPAKQAVDLVNLNVSVSLVMQVTVQRLMELEREWTIKDLLAIQRDLIGGVYGAGLISHREYEAAVSIVDGVMSDSDLTIGRMVEALDRSTRIVEWAQATVGSAFWDVWEPWTLLIPEVKGITDDIIRSSLLLNYASLVKSLRQHLLGKLNLVHDVLGQKTTEGIRALNPGLAYGPMKFYSAHEEGYNRDDILALETTNAELNPVAGIITKDEGNVVSHVQLLARALGIPNAVFLKDLYAKLSAVKSKDVFYVATPKGRVLLKTADGMDETDKGILFEYERQKKRTDDADVKTHASKLTIDADRLDLSVTDILHLSQVRRKDSGAICGPKAAFLGELMYQFPDSVAPGVVIPFGVYRSHFEGARVAVPKTLQGNGLAKENTPLPAFVRETYDTFFGKMLKDPGVSTEKLEKWIRPRLDVIRYSIKKIKLNPTLVEALRAGMAKEGLMDPKTGEMKGVFLRSDTNVEDMPNFNGAGLNLTIFNLKDFEDILTGIKDVWASPFTYRSFSWRQSVISDPNLVFPSIVVLKSIPSDKSGVLITANVDNGDTNWMTIATAEGVGGTVDNTPAETLLYGPDGAVLLNQFKAREKKSLVATGGIHMEPSTGSEYVLDKKELKALVAAATRIAKEFAPEKSTDGQPLPWDIEYGFAGGHLWLFQTRPFVGNSDIRNLPALAALDKEIREKEGNQVSLEEQLKWMQ